MKMNNSSRQSKAKLCNTWLFKGSCPRQNCTLAHGIDELNEAIQSQPIESSSPSNKNVCIHYANKGFCQKGDNCKFSHSGTLMPLQKQRFIPMVSNVNENFEGGPSSATLSSQPRRPLEFESVEVKTKRIVEKLVKKQLTKMELKSKLQAPFNDDDSDF